MSTAAAPSSLPPAYSPGEELANVATHGLGDIASAAGVATLLACPARFGDAWRVASTAVFGTTMVLLYAASTVYPASSSPRFRHVAKVLGQASIYLLIAGSYTPFTLLALRGPWGWGLFAAVWGLALVGVGLEAFWVYRPKWVSAAIYLAMGWMVVLAGRRLVDALPPGAFALLVAGGLLYSGGTVFYLIRGGGRRPGAGCGGDVDARALGRGGLADLQPDAETGRAFVDDDPGRGLGGSRVGGPGASIGALGVLTRDHHGLEAVAETEVLALEQDVDAVFELLEDNFAILRFVLQDLCRQTSTAWSADPWSR